jgi:sulfite reductase alpha subunit-like flavoprotein
MEGKASEKLEEIGKQYLDNLINNFDSKSLSQNKSSIKEENHPLKNLNKKKIFIENNPCVNQGEDYYPELIPSFTILFATEMGTAEEFANTLQKEATEKLHLKAKVINVADVKDVKIFNESSLIVIIASTWGEGEPTDDCIEFNKMLKSKDFWDSFTNKDNLNVAVFGLGNTVYTFYNAQGKLFYKILVEENHLNPICELGLGNARGDIEQDFADWKDKIFFKKLYEFYSKNYEKNYEFYKKYNLLNEIVEKEEKEVAKNYELFSSEKKELINIDKKNYNQQVQNHLNTQKLKILNIEELRQNNTNGSTLKI